MIKLNNVKKAYTKEIQIGPLNIEIKKSGITSLIGPNGAGKSTMLLMMGRLLEMDEGQIFISGLDICNTPRDKFAKIVTILKQENHFVTRLTVRQLVGFGRFPHSHGRLTSEDEEIISKYIDFLDLGDIENRYIDELSGGQRQRAYIAMVLTQETEYVLLDEPLNNLDIARSVQMMNYLKYAANNLNRTIIMVVHDINIAAKYSDKICAMKNGEIVDFGTVDEILQGEKLTEIFETEIKIIDGPDYPIAVF